MKERHFPNWIEAFVDYNREAESPYSFLLWAAVGGIAAALRRKAYYQLGDLVFYPNMYIVLVADPGIARKGTALKPLGQLLRECRIPLAHSSTSREKMVQQIVNSADSITDEASQKVTTHCSLTIFSEEFTVFLGHKNFGMMDYLCDLYDCKEYFDHGTVSRGEDAARNVFLNMISATTPAMIQSELPVNTFSGGGLASRFVLICENQARGRSIPTYTGTEEGREHFRKLYEDLYAISLMKGRYKIKRNALGLYTDWYMGMPTKPPFDPLRFGGYWSRRQVHLTKLFMIQAASRDDSLIITLEDVQWAIEILSRAERKMPMAFSGVGRDKAAEIIQPILAEIMTRKEITYNELLGMFIRDTNEWELEKIITALEKAGWIEILRSMGGRIIRYVKDKGSDNE